jgi:hypothetical protein
VVFALALSVIAAVGVLVAVALPHLRGGAPVLTRGGWRLAWRVLSALQRLTRRFTDRVTGGVSQPSSRPGGRASGRRGAETRVPRPNAERALVPGPYPSTQYQGLPPAGVAAPGPAHGAGVPYPVPRNEAAPYRQAPQYEAPRYETPQNEALPYETPQNEAPQNEAPQNEVPRYEAPRYDAPQSHAEQPPAQRQPAVMDVRDPRAHAAWMRRAPSSADGQADPDHGSSSGA